MRKQISNWFLVGNRFDSGQDALWNIEDEPFSITLPYIHFKNGKKIFTEEINDLYGRNEYSKNLAKKLIKAIDKNNYRAILYQEKINILYKIFGWTDYGTNTTNIINNLVVYEVII